MKRWIGTLSIVYALAVGGCTPTPTLEPTSTPVPSPTATATLTATAIPTATATLTPPPELTKAQIQAIALSSVQIVALVRQEGELVPAWSGSGTILSSNGLIATNAHVVTSADALVVSIVSRTDRPPIPSYYAEPIEVNTVLDLALIQITTDLDGDPIVRSELRLPAMPRGDSDDMELGQDIHIFGYPGIGGDTLTFTQGTVSGFETEDLGSGQPERIWIKTDAEIAPGNSGGTAVDNRGLLVGIPTLLVTDAGAAKLGRLRPVNLVDYLTSKPPQRIVEASIYEPNDQPSAAYGPLEPGTTYTAYLHQNDIDLYFIKVQSLGPIQIDLTDIPPGVDYDLGLLNSDVDVVDVSEGETSSEHITYKPSSAGIYYIVVVSGRGYSLEDPYALRAVFNGEAAPPVLPQPDTGVTVQGRLVDANSGRAIVAAIVALLLPGVTGERFVEERGNQELVQVSSITDAEGIFVLADVPRGQRYSVVVVTEDAVFWQNDWLTVRATAPSFLDLGDIKVGKD